VRKSRVTRLLGLIVALTLVVAACGDGTAEETTTTVDAAATTTTAAAEETTTTAAEPTGSLLIWADANRAPVFESISEAFTEQTGVEVTVEIKDFGDMREAVKLAAPAGEGPDLFVGAHDWTGELAADGVIAPVELGAAASDFFQVALDGFSFEGQLYAVPVATEAIAMFYNADLVAEPPATLEEVQAACEALDAIENCLGVPGGGDGPDFYHNVWFITAPGGYVFAYDPATGYDTSDVGLDTEGAIEGAQVIESLTADGVMASTNYDTAKNLFLEGSQPFWVTGPWEVGTLNDSELNWGVAKLPTINGNTPKPFVGAQGVFTSAFSENAVIAQSFLVDFIATTETQLALYEADPRNPAMNSVLEELSDDEVVQTFTLSGADGTPMPNVPAMNAVWGAAGDNILALRNGEVDAPTAMETAAEQVRAALAE
jgi:maltose-binding protein MalE